MIDPKPSTLTRILAGLTGAFIIALIAFVVTRPGSDQAPAPAPPPTGRATAQVNRTFPTTAPAIIDDDRALQDIPTPEMFDQITAVLGTEGAATDDTLTFTIPRRDVVVFVDGYEVPVAAGVNHTFHFFRCPCGTMLVHGHYLLHDYELNDVIDALRQNPDLHIVSTAPFLLAADPRLTLLRFQGEAHPHTLATTLRRPFRHIGPNRTAVDPTDQIPD